MTNFPNVKYQVKNQSINFIFLHLQTNKWTVAVAELF